MSNYRTSASKMAIFPLAEVDRGNRLLTDYLLDVPSATDLFAHEPEEMTERARTLRAPGDRTAIAEALASYQQHIGADQAAIDAAQLLADPATPVVTTGQQPGLLTGPLYTVFKAMTAINVAERLSKELGRKAVPVFWVGADDDDRAEIDHFGCWDQQLVFHSVHYPETAGERGQLVGNLPTDCYAEVVIDQLYALTEGLPFADAVRDILKNTQAESADLGEWFSRLMAVLFSAQGLVLCDPRLPALRRISSEILRRELTAPLQTTERINQRAAEIRRRGYRLQLIKPPDLCNLFRLDGERERIAYRNGRFSIRGEEYSLDGLLQELADRPDRFVPNAVLRPVVQEYLLGSAAFIAGPGELGYWAELAPVFDALQVDMPPVVPRAGATIVPSNVARTLHQWNVNPLLLYFDYDQVRFSLLESDKPEPVERGFASIRHEVERHIAALTQVVTEVDSTLAQSALATHQRILNEIERLERKTLKAVERQSTSRTERLENVRKTLYPRKNLQERTLNIFSVLARFGPDILPQIRALLDLEEGRHLFIEL